MSPVIMGNLFSLLATGTDLFSAAAKSARSMLLAQTLSQVLLGASSFVLGGYSAVVQNCVSIVRNLTALGKGRSVAFERVLIVLAVVLGAAFNNLGWLGWLPILANLEYSVAVFRFKDNERALKVAFAVCIVLFVVFNFAISNYVGAGSNLVVLFTTIAALVRGRRS